MRPPNVAHGETETNLIAKRSQAENVTQGDLLRFITCGSVDDGKSTLIGRLLFEAGAVFEDQLEALDRDSRKFGTLHGGRDYALLVDGLSAEREQGITIDVAYRYFATARRSFIVADTPGHEQYTRNMATGASTADCAIILVDARLGVLPQTRRHSFIVSLMGVKRIVVAVNKMDLVDFDQRVFDAIADHYRQMVAGLDFTSIEFIPVSARDGNNISQSSERMPWYHGPALLPWLETVTLDYPSDSDAPGILPVQYVNRPDHHFRGFAGRVATGRLQRGDEVISLPSMRSARLSRIVTADGDLTEAQAGQAVTLVLDREIDTSRGDVLVTASEASRIKVGRGCTARVLVTGDRPLQAGDHYEIKLGTAMAQTVISAIHHALDIENFTVHKTDTLPMNAIGRISLRLDRLLPMLPYRDSVVLGGFILIDRITRQTIAFGFIEAEGEAADGPASGHDAQPLSHQIQQWCASLIGAPASVLRQHRIRQASWLVAQATLLALVLVVLAVPLALIGWVVLLHTVLSPLLKLAHDRFWQSRADTHSTAPDTDLGEGI